MKTLSFLVIAGLLLKCLKAQDVITVEGVVGSTAELPCNVVSEKNDDKLNILAWYRNGSTTAFYSRDQRGEGSVMSSNKRYRLISQSDGVDKLQVLSVRPSDAGLYLCHADFASSPTLKTYSQLIVIEPPQRLWVVHENGTRIAMASVGSNTSKNIGPYYIGDTIHLVCVAYEGKPKPTLSWWTEQRLLKNANTPLSEQRVRSDLMFGPLGREDHGRVFTCYAKNNEKTEKLAIDVIVDMYLPPQLVSVRAVAVGAAGAAGAGRARAGDVLGLQCRVIGARPLPSLIWRLNDSQLLNLEQNVTIDSSQRLVVSEIQLSITPEYDESQVTCCAPAHQPRSEQFICATNFPLTVLYPPVLEIVVDKEEVNNTLSVVKGSDVSMNCSYQANPSIYQLTWFHEEDMLGHNADQSEKRIEKTLTLSSVSETDAGEYVCAATNDEGSTYSEPVTIDVTYPPYCEDESISEFGVGDDECVNLTCKVKANPEPTTYNWLVVSAGGKSRENQSLTEETTDPVLVYKRPNGTSSVIYCWAVNGVAGEELRKCTWLVAEQTAPRAPAACRAAKLRGDVSVACRAAHDGGRDQKFKFTVKSLDSEEQIVSIINMEPKFMIEEPKQENYKFEILAFNDKGESEIVEIEKDSIVDDNEAIGETISAVTNITTLALALCGGVALLALAACGLVLCAHERAAREPPRAPDPPLCAYNTDESNCETYHDSDEGSECNVRRTESFRRATGRPRLAPCRHSLQNISRRRDADLCDHLVMHLPPGADFAQYNMPKPMNTFYTMPRKMRHRTGKEISDETSEVTHNSDGFSLPPPPDEFGTYRAAARIRDVPKSSPTFTTITRHNSTIRDPNKYNNVIISPMNTVGLPPHNTLYTYPDDDQVNTNPFEAPS